MKTSLKFAKLEEQEITIAELFKGGPRQSDLTTPFMLDSRTWTLNPDTKWKYERPVMGLFECVPSDGGASQILADDTVVKAKLPIKVPLISLFKCEGWYNMPFLLDYPSVPNPVLSPYTDHPLYLLSENEGVGVCKILKEKEYEVLVGDRELAIPLNIEFIP